MSKTIKLTDEAWEKLANVAEADGNTIAGEINILVAERNITKQICSRIDKMEECIRNINFSAHNQPQAQSMVIPPFPDQMVRQEAVYNTQSSNVQPEIPDRTYTEIIEEMKQLQEELKTLDDDDPRRKEIENRLRADNVDLSLLEDD